MPSRSKAQWQRETLSPFLRGNPERKASFATSSGLEEAPLSTPEDAQGLDYHRDLGYPGEYPFTRGIYPNMYRGRLWTMRQYAGFGSAEESNRRYRYLLEQGQTGLSVAFDLPTQMGYDSDHPLAQGEVGKVGVPVCSLRDMETLFEGIPLDRVSTSMTINATASVLLALYLAVARRQGVPFPKLRGTVQNDILKEYIARGTYIYPPEPSLRLVTDLFAYCAREAPNWNTISISGYHMREAGATAAQELAFTFANALAYVRAARGVGLKTDDLCPQVSFFFVAQSNLLEEVAKFRAARRLWARLARERLGARDPRSMMLRFHAQTAGVTLTAQQPENNVVRSALQALAAVLGGAQSLHVNSRDEALGLPTEESALLSLRTQQLIAQESGVADTVDPLGGSYYVERLTRRLEEAASAALERIEAMGGALAALEQGYQMREIAESAYRFQKEVEAKERIIVGVNEHVTDAPPIPSVLRLDPAQTRRQVERLQALRRSRDNAAVRGSLRRLEEAARGTDNTMPAILECVESYATLGEISDALREVWGEWRPLEGV